MSGKYRFEDNEGNLGIIGPGVDAQFWYGDVFAVTREEAYATAGTLLAFLNAPSHVEAMKRIAGAPMAQGLTDDDMRRLHDKSQMGWGHDWLKFGRLVEAAILAQAVPSKD